jgi:hypothetical protein
MILGNSSPKTPDASSPKSPTLSNKRNTKEEQKQEPEAASAAKAGLSAPAASLPPEENKLLSLDCNAIEKDYTLVLNKLKSLVDKTKSKVKKKAFEDKIWNLEYDYNRYLRGTYPSFTSDIYMKKIEFDLGG